MRRIGVAVIVAVSALTTSPATAFDAGPARSVFGAAAGQEPAVTSLSPATADGGDVAAVLNFADDDFESGDLFGAVVDDRGRQVGAPQRWSLDAVHEAAYSAVGAEGRTGVAVWLQDNPDDQRNDILMMRRFDAGTAEPVGEPVALGPMTDLYDIQAYGDGYLVICELTEPRAIAADELVSLDAQGQMVGQPRVLRKGRGVFRPSLYGNASRERALLVTEPGNSVAFESLGPGGRSHSSRSAGSRNDRFYAAAHVAGGTWMTLWTKFSNGRVFTRRLSADGDLGPPELLDDKIADGLLQFAYGESRGLLIDHEVGGCGFKAIALDATGAAAGAPDRFRLGCSRSQDLPELAQMRPTAGGDFLYAFTGSKQGRPQVFATTLG